MTMAGSAPRVRVGGPWFEDFAVGQVFDDAPALTLGAGHAACGWRWTSRCVAS
jgi:hypothetical protein